jgi:hypothetical protein
MAESYQILQDKFVLLLSYFISNENFVDLLFVLLIKIFIPFASLFP